MRTCGQCTLCCKIYSVEELNKPKDTPCNLCTNKGCSIYSFRPNTCRIFECFWLKTPEVPDHYRPDKLGLLVDGNKGDNLLKVMLDPDKPTAAQSELGKEFLDLLVRGGNNLVIVLGYQLTYVPGHGREVPKKLVLDWVL